MTRETKVGLLFGMALILVIGILVSDFLVTPTASPEMTNFAPQAVDGAGQDDRLAARQDPTPVPTIRREFALPGEAQQSSGGDLIDQPLANRDLPPSAIQRHGDASRALDAAIAANRAAERRELNGEFQPNPYANDRYAGSRDYRQTPEPIDDASLYIHRHQPQQREEPSPRDDRRELIAERRAEPEGVWHEVERSESLYQIARKHYGNGEMWQIIRDANPGLVGESGEVRAGVKIRIPVTEDLLRTGQFERVAASNDAVTPSGVAAGGRYAIVVVQPRQTLSEIAEQHLGSSRRWEEILEANRDQITDARQLREGMQLRIPRTAEGGGANRVAPPANEQRTADRPTGSRPAGNGAGAYTVKAEDSLYRIAATKLGDGNRWREILELNKDKIPNENRLQPGTVLILPAR